MVSPQLLILYHYRKSELYLHSGLRQRLDSVDSLEFDHRKLGH